MAPVPLPSIILWEKWQPDRAFYNFRAAKSAVLLFRVTYFSPIYDIKLWNAPSGGSTLRPEALTDLLVPPNWSGYCHFKRSLIQEQIKDWEGRAIQKRSSSSSVFPPIPTDQETVHAKLLKPDNGWYAQPLMLLVLMPLVPVLLTLVLSVLVLLVLMG